VLLASTPAATIRQTSVSAMDNNVFLLTSKSTGQQILIDAAADPPAIKRLIAEAADDGPSAGTTGRVFVGSPDSTNVETVATAPASTPEVALIVTTHCHFDHIGALADMAKTTGARLAAGKADIAKIEAQTGLSGIEPVDHGQSLSVPGLDLKVIAIRGHTPGSIVLDFSEVGQVTQLFTGDSLFPGGVGNTWGDAAAFASMLADIKDRLFAKYPGSALVHPGHGQSTTIGAERPMADLWALRGW